jgi:hypothetical protein
MAMAVREAADFVSRHESGWTLRVGAGAELVSISDAARIAQDGDTVEIAAGEYRGEVAVWTGDDLTIRGVGVRPMLIADGRDAEGKAIFVVRGRGVRIENPAFAGSRVSDRNGAGIRIERGPIRVSGCVFEDNESGILAGNDPEMEIDIENCAFAENGAGDGASHNLYAGTIARLSVTGSYFARARVGHLLKSRARENHVSYCRLSGEGGTGSYELAFPNGGNVLALGNLIQQGPRSETATMVSYGAEGYRGGPDELTLAFNTIVNDRPRGGTFVFVRDGARRVALRANLLVGRGSMAIHGPGDSWGNGSAQASDFANAAAFDYRLRMKSRLVGSAGAWGSVEEPRPEREYVHPARSVPLGRFTAITPLSPGAFQRLSG